MNPILETFLENVSSKPQEILFIRGKDPKREIWDGPRCPVEVAAEIFGFDSAYLSTSIETIVEPLLEKSNYVFFNSSIKSEISDRLKLSNYQLSNPSFLISKMRIKKSEAEQELMRKSGKIAAESMKECMKYTQPGLSEFELGAKMEFECKKRGAQRLAYPPVVAGGINANTLHYIINDQILKDGDLVLVDAGAEYHGYASDITRTWPINGKFTNEQSEIYSLVLYANSSCIQFARKADNLFQIHALAEEILKNGLKYLGIIKENQSINLSRFFPHFIGHFLGMDTHDVNNLSSGEKLEPGMVITIEPGLYIPTDEDIPQKYRGIGIRIEDNILLRDGKEPEVLTSDIPKYPKEIEELMKTRIE